MTSQAAPNPFLEGSGQVRSLNRVRIAALPAGVADEGLVGEGGYSLLGARAFRELIVREAQAVPEAATDVAAAVVASAQAQAAGAPPPDARAIVVAWFDDECLRPLATRVAAAYGRRMGALFAVLLQGTAANRAARPEWEDRHWACWRMIEGVEVGGGLLAGRTGEVALMSAREVLRRAGAGLRLELSRFGAFLPLVGLARMLPAATEAAALLDFGHTSVKRASATYEDGALRGLRILDPAPAPCGGLVEHDLVLGDVRRRWEAMAALSIDAWRQADHPGGAVPTVGLAVATYLEAGQPPAGVDECYGNLRLLGPNLATFAAADLERQFGTASRLALAQDGDAAAFAHAGAHRTAVVTLGTALGIGFAPEEGWAWPLSASFEITTA